MKKSLSYLWHLLLFFFCSFLTPQDLKAQASPCIEPIYLNKSFFEGTNIYELNDTVNLFKKYFKEVKGVKESGYFLIVENLCPKATLQFSYAFDALNEDIIIAELVDEDAKPTVSEFISIAPPTKEEYDFALKNYKSIEKFPFYKRALTGNRANVFKAIIPKTLPEYFYFHAEGINNQYIEGGKEPLIINYGTGDKNFKMESSLKSYKYTQYKTNDICTDYSATKEGSPIQFVVCYHHYSCP